MSADCRLTVTARAARDAEEKVAAQRLRVRVFCEEQGVERAEELDGLDEDATHVVALDERGVVATCRLRSAGGSCKLERMAVERRYRGLGVGRSLLEAAEREARRLGARGVVLHAQTAAREFYERNGYSADGDVFDEAGIEHLRMTKPLGPA